MGGNLIKGTFPGDLFPLIGTARPFSAHGVKKAVGIVLYFPAALAFDAQHTATEIMVWIAGDPGNTLIFGLDTDSAIDGPAIIRTYGVEGLFQI